MPDISKWTLIPLNEDRKAIIEWKNLEPGFQQPGQHGTGVLTGRRSGGLFCLDCDDMTKGLPGPIPRTFAVKTRRGLHLYFYADCPAPTCTQIFPGWDCRGEGGMAVLVAEGYEIACEDEPAPAPMWLLQAFAQRELEKASRPKHVHTPVDLGTVFGAKLMRAAVEEAKSLPTGEEGERDTALFLAAVQLVRGRGLSVDAAANLLNEFYAPRSGAQDTTCSPERVYYKCQEAAEDADNELNPFTEEDVKAWLITSQRARAAASVGSSTEVPTYCDTEYEFAVGQIAASPDLRKSRGMADLINTFASDEGWSRALKFDEFACKFIADRPPIEFIGRGFYSEDDVTAARLWLEAIPRGITAGKEPVLDALRAVALSNKFHPLMNYLQRLPPCDDPETTLLELAINGLHAKTPIECALVRKFLIGAVKRVLEPGAKHDGVLVLHGPQGRGKSEFLFALSPDKDWIQESLPDLENKDSQEALMGRWLVEIPELQSILRKDENAVKDFLTRRDDSYRRPYERGSSRHPRQCVFIGTTNDDDFLREAFSRRYWIVDVGNEGVDLPWVTAHRDQIWAAALALVMSGASNALTPEESEALTLHQQSYQQTDPWSDRVEKWLEGKDDVSTTDIYVGALNQSGPSGYAALMDAEVVRSMDAKVSVRIKNIMRRLGWTERRRGKATRARVWKRPPTKIDA